MAYLLKTYIRGNADFDLFYFLSDWYFCHMSIAQSAKEEHISIPIKEYEQTLSDLAQCKAQLAELQRMVFGRKSERFIASDNDQLSIFQLDQNRQEAPQTKSVTYQRKVKAKQKPVRMVLPANLPRQEEVIEPEDLQEGMKKIGEEVTEILEHIPGKLFVRRIVRPKYVKGKEDGVKVAQLPSLPIPKGNAGPGLLAHIMVSKWVDHLPYYRQIQMFKREGVILSDSTFNGWFNATANLLTPLYEVLVEQVQNQTYLQADESPIKVQDSHKQGASHLGYHWVYHAPKVKLAVFDYQSSRSQIGPRTFLKKFKGYLQTDGYAAYNEQGNKEGITLLACMAHARRYFDKALDNDKHRAEHALSVIQSLYQLERESDVDENTLLEIRQDKAIPILKEWKLWLEEQQGQISPKSSIGKAVNYTLSLWSRLINYTKQAELKIDNNAIENIIRPMAIGRKNYLFAGSHQAAQKAAMFYSFFACCKLHDVNPYKWLKHVLENIPDQHVNKLEELLPNNFKNIK